MPLSRQVYDIWIQILILSSVDLVCFTLHSWQALLWRFSTQSVQILWRVLLLLLAVSIYSGNEVCWSFMSLRYRIQLYNFTICSQRRVHMWSNTWNPPTSVIN